MVLEAKCSTAPNHHSHPIASPREDACLQLTSRRFPKDFWISCSIHFSNSEWEFLEKSLSPEHSLNLRRPQSCVTLQSITYARNFHTSLMSYYLTSQISSVTPLHYFWSACMVYRFFFDMCKKGRSATRFLAFLNSLFSAKWTLGTFITIDLFLSQKHSLQSIHFSSECRKIISLNFNVNLILVDNIHSFYLAEHVEFIYKKSATVGFSYLPHAMPPCR